MSTEELKNVKLAVVSVSKNQSIWLFIGISYIYVDPPNAFLKRMACIGSCAFQNCATGYCAGRTCKCSRCNSGPVRGGKKRSISESENTTDLKVFACDSSCARQNCSMGLYDGETCECTQCEHNQRID